MRTCVIFRGENYRTKRGITSALECVDNWKEAILDVIECDVVFFTYPSVILEELIQQLSPVHVCTNGYGCQETNVLTSINWMIENKNNYDRFVLLRFDFMYRLRINEWPHWDKNGIILTSKDVSYPTLRFYHDMVFVIDAQWVDHFKNAFIAENKLRSCLHHIGRYLEEMPSVPFYVMYPDNLYRQIPICATHPVEPRPILSEGPHFHLWDTPSPPPTKILPQNKLKTQNKQGTTMKRTRPFVIFNKKK